MKPPGSRLLEFTSQWFDDRTVAGVFQPLVADLQHEWSAAAPGRRRWIALQGRVAFVVAFIATYPRVLRTPTPSWLVRRVLMRIAVFCAIVSVLSIVPVLRQFGTQLDGASLAVIATIVLLPLVALLTNLLPFAMTAGIDPIRGDDSLPPDVMRGTATKLLIATTLWMVIGTGWIVPASDQVWRTAVMAAAGGSASGYVPPRGVRELSTPELLFHPERAFVQRQTHVEAASLELWRRVSLILLPLALACLRWHANNAPRVRPGSVIVGGAAGFAVTSTLNQLHGVGVIAFLLIPAFTVAHQLLARRRGGGMNAAEQGTQ
jgi:hypothetical protein